MSAGEVARVRAVLHAGVDGGAPTLETISHACVKLLPITGASLVLNAQQRSQSVASAFDGRAGAVQDLEFTLGEGPVTDACADGSPVLVDDVAAAAARWPQFAPAIEKLGVRALYAFPLQRSTVKLGALLFYRDQPGALSSDELDTAALVATLVTELVLELQAQAASESLAWGLDLSDYRAVVHQATGMVSVQLNCGMEEALVRIRGYAFGADRPIDDVVKEVVARRLRFEAL